MIDGNLSLRVPSLLNSAAERDVTKHRSYSIGVNKTNYAITFVIIITIPLLYIVSTEI